MIIILLILSGLMNEIDSAKYESINKQYNSCFLLSDELRNTFKTMHILII